MRPLIFPILAVGVAVAASGGDVGRDDGEFVVVSVMGVVFFLFLLLWRKRPIDAATRSFTQSYGSIEDFEKNDAAQYRHTNAQKSSNEEILHKFTGRLKFWVPSYRLCCKN